MQALAGFGRKYQFRLPFLRISDESEKEERCSVQCTMNITLRCEEGNKKGFLIFKEKGVKEFKIMELTFV